MDKLSPIERNALSKKWLDKSLSEDEQLRLDNWYKIDVAEPLLWKKDSSEAELYHRMRRDFNQNKLLKNRKKGFQWARYSAIAAGLALFIWSGIYVHMQRQNKTVQELTYSAPPIISPGGNKALLRLSDGREIALDEKQSEIRSGESLSYSDGKPLPFPSKPLSSENSVSYLALITPKGGTYSVTLPDGSHVQLNASSCLKYPVRFSKESRIVELEGEGYFHIKHMPSANSKGKSIPFIVKTKEQEVEVLGTQFNISAYAAEKETKTTLVDGRVKVSSMGNKQHKILNPGEQTLLAQGNLSITKARIEGEIAWTKGLFDMENKNLEQLMNQLARWYDIEVQYQGSIPKIHFFGKLRRDNSFSEVADILRTAGVKFYWKNQRVLVIEEEKY